MVREIIPEHSRRADAFALWNRAPMPMVTLMKTLDVTHLVRFSRRHRYKINMLLCWCVGRAAARMEDFYLLPVGDKLMEYDCLAVNTVVMTQNGDIQTCDLPLSSNLEQFNRTYLELTGQVAQTGQPYDLSGEAMVIGTSALARYDIDGAVNLYAGCYNNPFLIWGRYRRRWFRALLPISFQFHHAQLAFRPHNFWNIFSRRSTPWAHDPPFHQIHFTSRLTFWYSENLFAFYEWL